MSHPQIQSQRGSVGSPDRAQRLTIGLALLILNLISILRDGDVDVMRWIALAIQVELILTGLFGWCPLYWSFGTHSCASPAKSQVARQTCAQQPTDREVAE